MNKEDKELLLRDLCARLPYGVKCRTSRKHGLIRIKICVLDCHWLTEVQNDFYKIKPYLFPLSSMTEEELNDFYEAIRPAIEVALDACKADKTEYEGERPITLNDIKTDIVAVDWMLKNHFDMNGLIEKGLAIDATGLNIYKEETK